MNLFCVSTMDYPALMHVKPSDSFMTRSWIIKIKNWTSYTVNTSISIENNRWFDEMV